MNQPSEPLGLTVHSLPQPVDAMARQRSSGRFKMLLIMAACAAPMIASYALYYGVRPTGGATAYSDLIQPTVPMPAVPAQPLGGGAPQVLRGLAGQWLLVVVDSGACAEACEKRLYMQRQLREMNGRDRDRIDKLWLVVDDAPVRPELQQALAEMTQPWKVTQLSHKPFPSGRVTHGVIHALHQLRQELGLSPEQALEQVSAIHVDLPPLGFRLVGRPMVHQPAPNYARLSVNCSSERSKVKRFINNSCFLGHHNFSFLGLHFPGFLIRFIKCSRIYHLITYISVFI
jgi:hypothetical protein